jgi:hypothetical protein
VAPPHPQDLLALRLLFAGSGGAEGLWVEHGHWLNTDYPLAAWHGVKVDPKSGRVTELWLRANGLTRGVPEALGLLAELQFLDLEANALGGALPACLACCPKLAGLWLGGGTGIDLPEAWAEEHAESKCNSRDEVIAHTHTHTRGNSAPGVPAGRPASEALVAPGARGVLVVAKVVLTPSCCLWLFSP